jgi:hypothetical protein
MDGPEAINGLVARLSKLARKAQRASLASSLRPYLRGILTMRRGRIDNVRIGVMPEVVRGTRTETAEFFCGLQGLAQSQFGSHADLTRVLSDTFI